jgi:5-deoxy-glucuronate isomerase
MCQGENLNKNYLYKVGEIKKGYTPIVSPENSELKFIEFGRLLLPNIGEIYISETDDNEAVLTIFGGRCSIDIKGIYSQKVRYQMIGIRDDVFDGKPTMVFLPKKVRYKVVAETSNLDMGISMAPSDVDWPPALVRPEDVIENSVGIRNWQRKVLKGVVDKIGAQRLMVGETINPPGNWSSYPPHKHDERGINEAPYEEVYFFRIKPSQGFGIQRIYTHSDDKEPLDEVFIVKNGDTVVIPRGYHPIVAASGYQLYYHWILAGEERRYGAWSCDSNHRWLIDCEQVIKDVL